MFFGQIVSIVVSFFAICNAGTKEFLQDLSFKNPANWYPPHIPCSNSRVIYPSYIEKLTLDLQDLEVREIILPNNGKILINPGALKLSKVSKNSDKCPLEDVRYINEETEHWMNPKNWREISDKGNFGKLAKPHYDQIPCSYDTAYFPAGRDYRIEMPDSSQRVKEVFYGNRSLSPMELNDLTVQNEFFVGYEELSMGPIINPNEKSCSSDEVCFCHNEEVPIDVCEFVKCPFPKCLYPIKPIFHCCPICGGVLQFPYENTQIHRILKKNVQKAIEEWESDKINWYIGGVVEGRNKYIQLVVVDVNEYDEFSTKLTKYIYKKLDESFKQNVEIKVSGIAWAGPNSPKGGLWETTVMFFIVMIFLLSIMTYYYPPGFIRSFNPFRPGDFARFDNRSREGSLFLATSHLSLDKAFENPMYNRMATSKGDKYEEVSISNDADTEDDYVEPIGETSFQK